MSKYLLRLPTDTYAYIEQEIEADTPEAAVEAYRALQGAWKGDTGAGLPTKEWCLWLDGYLAGKAGSIDHWNQMDEFQKKCINEVKKALKRIKSKQ